MVGKNERERTRGKEKARKKLREISAGKEATGKNWPEIIGGKKLAVTWAGGSLFVHKIYVLASNINWLEHIGE
jgi:hypothetical protein